MPVFSFLCVEKMLVISQHREENLTGIKLLQWWVEDEEVTLMTHGRELSHPEMLCPWLTAHPREDAVCLFFFSLSRSSSPAQGGPVLRQLFETGRRIAIK